jgi:hypothetical protein
VLVEDRCVVVGPEPEVVEVRLVVDVERPVELDPPATEVLVVGGVRAQSGSASAIG